MSQRGPASRPVSPPSAKTSASSHHISLVENQSSLRGGGHPPSEDGSQESSSVPSSHEERSQPFHRGLGVHNILNPPSQQPSATATVPAQGTIGYDSSVATPTRHFGVNPSMQRNMIFQGSGVHAQHDMRRPSGESVALGGAASERGSPGAVHPWPPLGAPRRYLTPRSPRASSLSYGSQARALNTQQTQHSAPTASDRSRSLTSEASTETSPHTHPGQPLPQQHSGGGALPGIPPSSNIPSWNAPLRSLTNPTLGHAISSSQEQPTRYAETPVSHQRPPIYPAPSPYATSAPPPSRDFPSMALGDPRWPPMHGGQQGLRSAGTPEEQSTLMFATPGGEPIPIMVDNTNGSRQADEKRLRNAGASARFRQRKKDKDQQKDSAIEKLQAQNRGLEKRIRDLELERERYRADRDRLRDVVHRTPSISDLAYQSPRSPPTRSLGSYAGSTPMRTVAPPPAPITSGPYGTSDPITGERPSRRRRTDSQLEFSMGSYATTLPPPNYNAPISRPGTPPAGGLERLPPLRLEQSTSSGAAVSDPASSNTPTQTFGLSPVKRETYESGWATRPGGPSSGGPSSGPGQR